MFELAASHVGGKTPQRTVSRPELRQVQQDPLTECVEGTRGVKRDEREQRSGSRPHCANQQPEHSSQTGRYRYWE